MADAARLDDLTAWVHRLAHALRQAAPDNALSEQALDYLKQNGLVLSPHQPDTVPDGWRDGVESVAKMVEGKANDYAKEFGSDDMGRLSFGVGQSAEVKREYHWSLLELTDEIRAMLGQEPAAVPPVN